MSERRTASEGRTISERHSMAYAPIEELATLIKLGWGEVPQDQDPG